MDKPVIVSFSLSPVFLSLLSLPMCLPAWLPSETGGLSPPRTPPPHHLHVPELAVRSDTRGVRLVSLVRSDAKIIRQ